MSVNRRQSLKLVAVGGAALSQAGPSASSAAQLVDDDGVVFQHGVASGDPDRRSVVLWTRVTTDAESVPVQWQIASDAEFADVVGEGEATASPERDYTVKVIADGLRPNRDYFYRFIADGETSRLGRTHTLPTGPIDEYSIALATCSNYPFGHFNAYDAIAKDEQVDLVLHTGDYIYEYGSGEWGDDTGQVLGRPHDPPHEIVTLEDYRRRHAQYKSDPGSKAMHAAHPFIACWDDHETTNNPWIGGAGNHQPDTEGPWEPRRDVSMQAYFEWMPIRDPEPGQPHYAYWRTYEIGDLASLITLETRHTGRDQQPTPPVFDRIQSKEERDRYVQEVLFDPNRRMLSPEVEEHVRTSLEASVESGKPWRVLVSASPIARFHLPDPLAHGIAEADIPPDAEYMIDYGHWNLPWYADTWDGYPVARERLYQLAKDVGAQDLLVLTGDTHNFFANELHNEAGERVGVEIGTTGISSPGEFRDAGFTPEMVERVDAMFMAGMDEVRWTESVHNGYARIDLKPDGAEVTYVGVDNVLMPEYQTVELRRERVVKDGPSLAYV